MGEKFRLTPDGGAMFRCPGCDGVHSIWVNRPGSWQWDGSMAQPTISPSILEKSGHFARPGDCWCTYNAAHPDNPSGFQCHICHSFVKAGRIEFLSDCTHALAGQTVDLPDWE